MCASGYSGSLPVSRTHSDSLEIASDSDIQSTTKQSHSLLLSVLRCCAVSCHVVSCHSVTHLLLATRSLSSVTRTRNQQSHRHSTLHTQTLHTPHSTLHTPHSIFFTTLHTPHLHTCTCDLCTVHCALGEFRARSSRLAGVEK